MSDRPEGEQVSQVDASPVAPPSDTRPRARARVLTAEKAAEFARVLRSDEAHTVESAAIACGLRSSTVREALSRYEHDKCGSDEDEAICEVLARAKSDHIMAIRRKGFVAAECENKAATSWVQWQLEVQAPKEHPRKTAVEHSGKIANEHSGEIRSGKGLSKKAARELALKVLGVPAALLPPDAGGADDPEPEE